MRDSFNSKIEEVMSAAMKNLRSLVDVDVVVGEPIKSTSEKLTIIPLTKVSMGFVSGGGEYYSEIKELKKDREYPFSGGSGAGLSLQPIGFLVIDKTDVKIIKIDQKSAIEKLIEIVPEVANFISKNLNKSNKNE